ncbi:MAG: hypothetical protein H0U67_09975 [Gemmatimonadetes bacterium]|jgi:hypothetical protein|nr:hypothetical protein [Gemmatimonadota bacterium]
MDNEVVVIRTFSTELEASVAKAELDRAGIHSLLLSSDAGAERLPQPHLQLSHGIGLAVLVRDAETAEAILTMGRSEPE